MTQKKFSTDIFKLKALDRFILGELMGPFFFGMVAFTIILVAGSLLFKMADLVIQRGVSLGIVVGSSFTTFPGWLHLPYR